jgi:hypothetical protein
MKLIKEEIESVEFITETVGKVKKLYIKGPFLQAECVNRNKRKYPMHILEKEVKRYCDLYVDKDRALGELGHPTGPTINLDRVSHKIIDLYREGNNFIGKAQILSTPMGKIAESLIKEGVCLGVSSRGLGSLRPTRDGYSEVGEDFMLATAADIVADPSAPEAFVQGILEGVEWIYDASRNSWLIERTKKKVNRLVEMRQYEEKKLELFNEFLNSL